MSPDPARLTAEAAAAALGVSRSTLYAYVSRGLIRSEPAGGDRKARRYPAEDVERLIERRENRRRPERVAEGALRWGLPVLDSGVTLIADGRIYYRGKDALGLARAATLREVVELLWGIAPSGLPEPEARTGFDPGSIVDLLARRRPSRALDAFMLALPLAAAADPAAWDLSPAGAARSGWRTLRILAALSGVEDGVRGRRLPAICLGLLDGHADERDAVASRLLSAALVLAADHELNVSTFTVRCVASAGSNPYAAVAAGLAALQGTRHGGATERVEALLESAPAAGVRDWIAERLRRGERPPGFGHPLYPDGDPRGRALLELVAQAFPDAPETARGLAVASAVEALLDVRPNLDFGLSLLSRALALPAGTPLTLFALGRTIGWIAHAIEQYGAPGLIRPRARYVGPPPAG